MDRHVQVGIHELKNKIIEMGGLAEEAIALAVEGFLASSSQRAQDVKDIENRINRLHILVDELCVRLLATQQPMGSDLRFIVAVIKINADLERIGDQAVNVSGNAKRALAGRPLDLDTRNDFAAMCPATRDMVRSALDAFVRNDQRVAEKVLKMDDVVDGLKNAIFAKTIELMEQGTLGVKQGLDLILIARNLEKIGDHASNIAEDVIYATSGQDVRHPYSRTELKSP